MVEEKDEKLQGTVGTLKKTGYLGIAIGIFVLVFDLATILFMPNFMPVAFLGFFTSILVVSMSFAYIALARGIAEQKRWAVRMSRKEMPRWFRWFNPRWLIILYVAVNILGILSVILNLSFPH